MAKIPPLICRALCLLLVLSPALAAEPMAKNAPVVVEEEGEEGLAFSVLAPPGWAVAVGEAGEKFRCNAVVYERSRVRQAPDGMVRIRIQPRRPGSLDENLRQYINAYRAVYPKTRAEAWPVAHPRYRTMSKLLVDPGLSYEYTAFIDPGRGEDVFIVGMTKFGGAPAGAGEIAAYRAALASLKVLPVRGSTRLRRSPSRDRSPAQR